MPGVVEVKINVRRGNKVCPPLSMGHRIGYIIANGETIEEAKRYAKRAAKEINIL